MNSISRFNLRPSHAAAVLAVFAGIVGNLSESLIAAEAPNGFDAVAYRVKALQYEDRRREDAKRELDQLRARRQTLEDRVNYAKKVALTSFQIDSRGLVPQPAQSLKTFERWKQVRATTARRLLEFREKSAGSIANGSALNFFLLECGSTAFEHSFYRKNLKQSSASTEEDQMLRELTETYRLPKSITRHVVWRQGLTGPKLTGRLNELPLDTKWSRVLREASFKPYTSKIERLRDQALKELESGQPVSAKTADQLLDAVHDLMEQVKFSKREEIRRIKDKTARSHEDWQRYNEAEKHVNRLIGGAYRFVEGYELKDVALDPLNLEDGLTVEDLLAYMHQNTLTFAEADANGQSAYNMIFEMMTRYYVDLCAFRASIKDKIAEGTRELEAMRAEESELKEIARGNRLSNVQQFDLKSQQNDLKSLQTLKGIEGFRAAQKGFDFAKSMLQKDPSTPEEKIADAVIDIITRQSEQ